LTNGKADIIPLLNFKQQLKAGHIERDLIDINPGVLGTTQEGLLERLYHRRITSY
jgi:hypothetical protein